MGTFWRGVCWHFDVLFGGILTWGLGAFGLVVWGNFVLGFVGISACCLGGILACCWGTFCRGILSWGLLVFWREFCGHFGVGFVGILA